MFYASCTSTQNICKMHFEVGIIVPFVRITKLTVVLLKVNTGGDSDPLNPVKTQTRDACVGEHCKSVSRRFLKPSPSIQGRALHVTVHFAEVFQNFI